MTIAPTDQISACYLHVDDYEDVAGSNLDARAKCADYEERTLPSDNSNCDGCTALPAHIFPDHPLLIPALMVTI
jgi:hypothetical protein